MDKNLVNKEIYEDAFIAGGEYASYITEPSWKPDINENNIEEWSEDSEGNYIPATPLGYRDYLESRKDGLKNIIATKPSVTMTYEVATSIKYDYESFKLYDHIVIDEKNYVVVGNDEDSYFIATEDNHLYSIEYQK